MTPLPPYTHEPNAPDYFHVSITRPPELQEYLNIASARGWKLAALAVDSDPDRFSFEVVLERKT